MYLLKEGRMYTVIPSSQCLDETEIYLLQVGEYIGEVKIYYWVGDWS